MAIFGTKKEEGKPEAAPKAAPKAKDKKAPAGQPSVLATRVLKRPRVTEKAYGLNAQNQYVFVVEKPATKTQVKRAVEEAFGVDVLAVNIVRLPKKKRLFGRNRTPGFKPEVKKAIVTVKAGQSIEIFKAGI